jgi:hypothetical protein
MILTSIILALLVVIVVYHYLGYIRQFSKNGYQKISFEQFKSFYHINSETWGLYKRYISKKFPNEFKKNKRNKSIRRAEKEIDEYQGYPSLLEDSYKHLRDAKKLPTCDELYFSFNYVDYFKYIGFKIEDSKLKKQNEQTRIKLAKKKKDAEEYEALIFCLKKEISALEKDSNKMLKEQAELLRSV